MSNVQTIPSNTICNNTVAVDLTCNMNEFGLNLFQTKSEEDQRETYVNLTNHMNTLMAKLKACETLRVQYLQFMNVQEAPEDFDEEEAPSVNTQHVDPSVVVAAKPAPKPRGKKTAAVVELTGSVTSLPIAPVVVPIQQLVTAPVEAPKKTRAKKTVVVPDVVATPIPAPNVVPVVTVAPVVPVVPVVPIVAVVAVGPTVVPLQQVVTAPADAAKKTRAKKAPVAPVLTNSIPVPNIVTPPIVLNATANTVPTPAIEIQKKPRGKKSADVQIV